MQTEVNYLGTLSHPYLVKLVGYCLEDEQRLLVYEFMPRGSLENHLFRSKRLHFLFPGYLLLFPTFEGRNGNKIFRCVGSSYFQPLPWNLRMKIALGAAKGLAYLHSDEAKVIYRDFKTSNVLLDAVCSIQ